MEIDGGNIRELCFSPRSKNSFATFPLFRVPHIENSCIMQRKREKKGLGGKCTKSSSSSKI